MTGFGTYGVELSIEAAFGYAPYATPAWTDIAKYVTRIRTRRGKASTPLPRAAAGQCTLTLNNDDGRFDPNNTSSPYSPDVVVSVPIRVRATWDSTTYPLFYGFVNSWTIDYPHVGHRSVVNVPCVDGMQLLNQFDISGETFGEQNTTTRIGAVLDAAGWPAGWRDLDTGLANVEAFSSESEVLALAHLSDVAAAEVGRIFVAADGDFQFHNRTHNAGTPSPVGTFGPSDLPYLDVMPRYDDDRLYNDVRVTRTDGETQTATDATSITNHRYRSLTVNGIMDTDMSALNAAEWYLAMFKDVETRIERVVISPLADPTNTWPVVLDLDLRDVITVKTNPIGGGTGLDQVVRIDTIRHDIRVETWKTTLGCYPLADVETADYWVVGTSELDTETALA